MMTDDEVISALHEHVKHSSNEKHEARKPNPPITAPEYEVFRNTVQFPSPELLRRMYMEVGDGSWGPWHGLCRLGVRGDEDEPQFSVLELWRSRQYWNEQKGAKPSHNLSFCDWGCTVFSVLDLKTGAVGIEDEDDKTLWQAKSLNDWIEKWLSGEDLSFKMEKT